MSSMSRERTPVITNAEADAEAARRKAEHMAIVNKPDEKEEDGGMLGGMGDMGDMMGMMSSFSGSSGGGGG